MASAAASEQSPTRPRRLMSLDAMRGAAVAGMILVNAAAYLERLGHPSFPILLHSPWAGFTLADAVFPAFLFMVGVSLAVSLGSKAGQGVDGAAALAIGRRGLALIVLGVLLTNTDWVFANPDYVFRPLGVLQRIGVVYLAAALLHLSLSWRWRVLLAALILLAYWALAQLPYPGGTADLTAVGMNWVSWLERWALGDHLLVKGPLGYDPEGLASTLPAIAQGLIGGLVGEWLARSRAKPPVGKMILAGSLLAAAGLAWGWSFPAIKNIWSSSFVLLSSGLSLIALALLHELLDRRRRGLWVAELFVPFGLNALAVYSIHELPFMAPIKPLVDAALARPMFTPEVSALGLTLLYLVMLWSIAAYFQHRRWFIRL